LLWNKGGKTVDNRQCTDADTDRITPSHTKNTWTCPQALTDIDSCSKMSACWSEVLLKT